MGIVVTDLVPALLHDSDQLRRGAASMRRAQGRPLRQLAVLVTQCMQHLLYSPVISTSGLHADLNLLLWVAASFVVLCTVALT